LFFLPFALHPAEFSALPLRLVVAMPIAIGNDEQLEEDPASICGFPGAGFRRLLVESLCKFYFSWWHPKKSQFFEQVREQSRTP